MKFPVDPFSHLFLKSELFRRSFDRNWPICAADFIDRFTVEEDELC